MGFKEQVRGSANTVEVLMLQPIGSTMWWFGPSNTVPDGWQILDGRVLLQADYPTLFAAYGHQGGTVDRSGDPINTDTHFVLPRVSGRFIRSIDDATSGIDPAGLRIAASLQGYSTAAPINTDYPDSDGNDANVPIAAPHKYGFLRQTNVGEARTSAAGIIDDVDAGYQPDLASWDSGDAETRPYNIAAYLIVKCLHIGVVNPAIIDANADTLDGYHASDLVLKSEFDSLFGAAYAATAPAGYTVIAYGVVSDVGVKLSGSDNWTVSLNASGRYQLYITDPGNFVVSVAHADRPFLSGDAVNANHDTVTGVFLNNAAENVQSFYVHDSGYRAIGWTFIAIKLD